MKKFLKNLFVFLVFLLLVNFFSFQKAKAAPEFQHLITATYTIKEDNSAHVEYHFKTTNKLNNNYLKSYTFTVPFEPLNLKTDTSPSPVKVGKLTRLSELNTYEMQLEFLNPAYGLEKVFEWSFSFDIKDIVIDRGMQKALIIPTFVQDASFVTYNISVNLSKKLGEIAYIYGNAGIQENESTNFLNFVSTRNPATNIIVLLNSSQEYLYEVKNVKQETKVALPKLSNKQQVTFSKFPSKEIITNQKDNGKFVTLNAGEEISGVIKAVKGQDTLFGEVDNEFPEYKYLNEIAENISSEGISKIDIARKLYEDYLFRFSIPDYRVKKDLQVDIKEDKFNVNPVELNYIYRYLLNKFDIQSRGTYGYVFPIQPFKTTDLKTDVHVWTQIWDGSTWIDVDPVWYLSSKGTQYFDNNDFHHLSFGTYTKIDNLKAFLQSDDLITVTPLSESKYTESSRNLDIEIENSVYMNREVKAKLINNSNYPISLKDINLELNSHDIRVTKQFGDLDMILYPNTSANLAFPLEYDLMILNNHENIKLDVKFREKSEELQQQTVNSSIIIQSNISSYVSIIIFVIFLIFSGLSVFAVTFYKNKVKN